MSAVAKGARAFGQFAGDLAAAGHPIQAEEVWGRTLDGERFRADGVFAGKNGVGMINANSGVGIGEAKGGPTSNVSERQVRIYSQVNAGNFYLEGPKAIELAQRLNLNVDSAGKVTILANRFLGVYLGVYEGSRAHLSGRGQRMQINGAFGTSIIKGPE